MNCNHPIATRQSAAALDGYCPICLRLAIQDRDALRDEAARLRSYVIKASVAATEREAALTDVSRLRAAIQTALDSPCMMGDDDIQTLLKAMEECDAVL